MAGSWPPQDHPYLTDATFEITSECSGIYNCIAWAAGDDRNFWWPDSMGIGYWPDGIPRAESMDAFVQAYQQLGYRLCDDGTLTPGLEKIAIFGIGPEGQEEPTHAALQLESGEWTSKMGPLEDIRHKTADAVRGPLYGKIVCFMLRPRPDRN